MSWRVTLLRAARDELAAAAARYEREEQGLGERFLGEVAAVRQRIATGPEHFQRWPIDPDYRRAVVDVFPFVVFYRVDEGRQSVVLVAVAHTSREPRYWTSRR